jgi:signal transduction histidine kinase/ligand-binding sensor domain-containing protein
MKAALLLSVVFLLGTGYGHAQTNRYKFNLVTSPDNKPFQKIVSMEQDANGYMWFIDQWGKCLIRYDGHNVKRYVHDPSNPNSPASNSLETLYADAQGKLWIGGDGLDCMDPISGVFTHYKHNDNDKNSLADNNIGVITADKEGTLWVGTSNGLDSLNRKTGTFTHFRHKQGDTATLSDDVIRSLFVDHSDVLWVGTGFEFVPNENGGLNKFDKKTGRFTRYIHDEKNPKSLANNKVRAILEDSKGNFWIGSGGSNGLQTMNRETGTFETYAYNPNAPDALSRPPAKKGGWFDHITFIKEDAEGTIWIGTYISGLNAWDPSSKKITRFEGSNGYPDSTTWNFFASRDGVLWIVTEAGDNTVSKLYRINAFRRNIAHIFLDRQCFSFYEENNGNLWIGTVGSGLIKGKAGSVESIRNIALPEDHSGLPMRNSVISFYQEKNGPLWVGTSNGIFKYDSISKKFTSFEHEPGNTDPYKKFIVAMVEDNAGSLFVVTARGLTVINQSTGKKSWFHHIPSDSTSMGTDALNRTIPGENGNMWLSTYDGKGVEYYDKQKAIFRHYLSGFHINNLCKDAAGVVWVCTEKGLYRYDKTTDQFAVFTDILTDIQSMPVYGIAEDDNKNLWVAATSSLLRIDAARTAVESFGEKDGIRTNSLASNVGITMFKTKDNHIVTGDNTGYYYFSPSDLNGNKYPPQEVITNFSIDNKNILPGKGSVLPVPITEINEIHLNYEQNIFSFGFVTLQYSSPEDNTELYKLENFDNQWRKAGSEKLATYFKVPPGHYIFRVKGTSNNGKWAERDITVTIAQPWWFSWWAICAYGLLLGSTVAAIYQLQKRRIVTKERDRTREKELAQSKEIEKAYVELKSTQAQLIQAEKMASLGELTAGIAHEIQNPLNFVNNFSEINKELIDELRAERSKPEGERNASVEDDLIKDIEENEQKINHHGKRADAIVKGMLQHSRRSTGIKEPTDINSLADEFIRLSFHGLRAKDKSFNANFKTSFDERIGKINVIPQDIGRVLLNLFNNAFYAVNEKKKKLPDNYEPLVEVSTKKTGTSTQIRVSDNGNGIPPDVINKIFQPFFTTKPAGEGTGLGLSLSYDIVTKVHNGELRAESKKEEGTVFVITLPNALSP